MGSQGSAAAFLLVAVDLLISHWPKTMSAAIPFLGSPELLSFDRNRHIHDGLPAMDLGGWSAIGPKEPAGLIRLADLKKRPSRRYALETLLSTFALDGSADHSALYALLAAASARLGQSEPGDTIVDPRFMARYALNMIDPANWPSAQGGRVYVSPPEEARHIAALQKERAAQTMDFSIELAIQDALEDSTRSNPEFVEHAVAFALRLPTVPDTPENVLRSRTNAIIPVAMFLARDGADALLDQYEGWAREVIAQAFASTEDIAVSRMRDGIRFNPVAIATLGLIHLWRRRGHKADRNMLLELAGRDDPHAAQGFGAGLAVIREIDPRFVPALLRCALVAQIQPTREWDDSKNMKEASQAQHRLRVAAAIPAEIAWLDNVGQEPPWPTFPPRMISVRQPLSSTLSIQAA